MNKRRFLIALGVAVAVAAMVGIAIGQSRAKSEPAAKQAVGKAQTIAKSSAGGGMAMGSKMDMRTTARRVIKGRVYKAHVTPDVRAVAAARAAALRKSQPAKRAVMNPLGVPDYFGSTPNYANSPTGIRKFIIRLPGLGPANKNSLGNYLPVATPDTVTFPGSDYYVIAVQQYTKKLHPDLPATKLRGYVQLNNGTDAATGQNTVAPAPIQYLGPIIVAPRDRPVRIKFINQLPTGAAGNLFIPTDTTAMGAGTGPNGGTELYTQNRATLHLHGGATPWISDGTPHQWTTPAGEVTSYSKGVSVSYVPDMWFDAAGNVVPAGTPGASNNPGPGALTFFYTNQQSARLMFYHDHAYGITRLNVYAGEAAGYVLQDPVEQEMVNGNVNVPVAQRKIPQTVQPGTIPQEQIPLVIQDKTFVPGSNTIVTQDPTWDTAHWGGKGSLWFPHVYMPNQNPWDDSGANAMGRWDYGPWFWPPLTTAAGLVHGEVPNPYYNPTTAPWEPPMIPGTPNPSLVPEAFMDTMMVNGAPYPYLKVQRKAYRFRVLNACNDRMLNLQLYFAKSNKITKVNSKGVPTLQQNSGEIKMVAAAPHPGDKSWPSYWPTDGRTGGVPDPKSVGPKFIVFGSEGGIIPHPVALKNKPIGYVYNRRDIVVLNVSNKTLFLGPAERADVVVDFSNVPAGTKIIMYNDAPAPVPAFDPRLDYYTGDPNQRSSGGAASTKIGYGPNTRTIMQFMVVGKTKAKAFNMKALQNVLPTAFNLSQPPIIVPEQAYGAATNTYSRIQDTALTFTPLGANAQMTVPMQPKAIQELFELDYGRMNATLGVELPFTNFNIQTTIPLGYKDPATEILLNSGTQGPITLGDGTQIWKITHNGVDTHAIHFHLFNVQLINRVGWDGAIRPPLPQEMGWKETVIMNPLEDAIVALRPVAPTLPFKIPDSWRPLDPTLATNAPITVTNPVDGNPETIPNAITDFGWEYVWHCHLLGHEENDMMRPMVFQVSPAAPSSLTATPGAGPSVALAWADNAANPKATNFTIQRATDVNFTLNLTTFNVNEPAITYIDTPVTAATTYYYRIRAENTISYSVWSAPATAVVP